MQRVFAGKSGETQPLVASKIARRGGGRQGQGYRMFLSTTGREEDAKEVVMIPCGHKAFGGNALFGRFSDRLPIGRS
jgi:hypothetical protein